MIPIEAIAALHAGPWYGSFALTGGGVQLAADLLAVPGASKTIADVRVPYAYSALRELLLEVPTQACSAAAARALAIVMLQNTLRLGVADDARPFGFALTASLATTSPKRGSHRVHVALHTLDAVHSLALVLRKDTRRRAEEELLAAALGWQALATLAELPLPVLQLESGEQIEAQQIRAEAHWRDLLAGVARVVDARTGAVPSARPRLVFSGSFNPMHDGHRRMAEFAEAQTRLSVEYELCVANVDKAPLDIAAIRHRLDGLPASRTVWLSRAGAFVDKSALFPHTTFIVGLDTMLRVAEQRFYADAAARERAFVELARNNARFLVFPRLQDDRFQSLDDLPLPAALRALCSGVAAHAFRMDVSSRAIRQQQREPDED